MSLRDRLDHYAATLDKMTVTCFGDDYGGTRDELLAGQYKSVLGDLPVMVYPFCVRTFQLGNTLGYYFNDLACANLTGSHFIAVKKHFDLIDPEALETQGQVSSGAQREGG